MARKLGQRAAAVLEFVQLHPAGVRAAEVDAALGTTGSARYLSRLVASGQLRKAGRGLYAVSDTSPSSDTSRSRNRTQSAKPDTSARSKPDTSAPPGWVLLAEIPDGDYLGLPRKALAFLDTLRGPRGRAEIVLDLLRREYRRTHAPVAPPVDRDNDDLAAARSVVASAFATASPGARKRGHTKGDIR